MYLQLVQVVQVLLIVHTQLCTRGMAPKGTPKEIILEVLTKAFLGTQYPYQVMVIFVRLAPCWLGMLKYMSGTGFNGNFEASDSVDIPGLDTLLEYLQISGMKVNFLLKNL